MRDIPIPKRMQSLPRDSKGRIVPFFVNKPEDGSDPDFRIVDPRLLILCYTENRCWVCGQKMGVHKCFVSGPMCCVNKVSSEPPSHYECAHYSVQVCPFLSTPKMVRRETGLPDELIAAPAGIPLYRNPGVAAIWVTKSYRHFSDNMGSFLFRMGPPERVEWYTEGRRASRAEIMDSIESGFPKLLELAEKDGPRAVKDLNKQYQETLQLVYA